MSAQRIGTAVSQVVLTSTDACVVRIGSWVRVRDDDGEEEFVVVPAEDADAIRHRLSVTSRLGRALLGTRAGDRVSYRAPDGIMGLVVARVRQSA
jgi:transcription elongation factor GreA